MFSSMARTKRYVEEITDDLTGDELAPEDAKDVYLSVDDRLYLLTLSEESITKLEKAVEPFLANVKPVSWPGGIKGFAKLFDQTWWKLEQKGARLEAEANKGRKDNAAVRAWAKDNGHFVSEKGKIPALVYKAYDKAHS